MTLSVHLHNCPGWTSATYAVGQRRSNDTAPVKAYECITAGVSAGAGGPTGTGADITDGAAHWKYLSPVDYTTLTAAIAGIGTLTDATELLFWNDAEWGMSLIDVIGNTTTSTNTLTMKPAPGESFRDAPGSVTNPLRYDLTKGAGIASTYDYGAGFIIKQPYVKIFGFQFRGTGAPQSRALHAVNGKGAGFVCDSCIFDHGQAGNGGIPIHLFSDGIVFVFRNCDFIINSNAYALDLSFGGEFHNCSISRIGFTAAAGTAISTSYAPAPIFTACSFFGFAAMSIGIAPVFTNCVSDLVSPPAGVTGGLVYADQFQNIGTIPANRDFRLKAGSGLINAGIANTAGVPAANDIFGTARPQGAAWDIGPHEFLAAASPAENHNALLLMGCG